MTTNTDEGSFGSSSKNEAEDDKMKAMNEERSGTNMELNELLENKPLYISVHQKVGDVRMKRQQQHNNAHGDVDNKDIREVNLDDEGDNKLTANPNSSSL